MSRSRPQRLYACALLLLGASSCVSSRADELRAPYLGAALHRAVFELDGTLETAGFEGEDTALKLLGGYRLSRKLAIEATYLDIGDEGGASQAEASEARVTALTVAAARIWPLRKVDLYGKLGLGYWRTEIRRDHALASRDSLLDPYAAIGVQYQVGRFALRADFDVLLFRVVNSLDGAPKGGGYLETFSVGTVWRFR